ncbi:hypothetical protein [Anaeromassilibacillus sp. SJQ-1]|uniref:hypothetical protein n=1 Tax=Anaeromassilibacillus sp. SJQ-1 TaxID=3375419 RepID=UPI00398A1EFF
MSVKITSAQITPNPVSTGQGYLIAIGLEEYGVLQESSGAALCDKACLELHTADKRDYTIPDTWRGDRSSDRRFIILENNITRAAGPGGQESTGTYLLTHTGAEVDAAIEGWQTAQAQADATASDIAEGKKAITKDGLVTGTMEESGGNCDLTDPMSVYKATRPGDWLPMPQSQMPEKPICFIWSLLRIRRFLRCKWYLAVAQRFS